MQKPTAETFSDTPLPGSMLYCCLNLVLQILCANQPAYHFLNQIRLRLPLPNCALSFFFSGKTRHLFIHQYSIGAHHGSFMDPTNKKNKQTNNNRFLVVGLLYEILVIVCSILDWYSLHCLLQFSKLWEERKKKKVSFACLGRGPDTS